MLENLDITNVLFLDIETVSGVNSYDSLNDTMKKLWGLKAPSALRKYGEELPEEEIAEAYNEKAGIYAEFGKIVCISVGIVVRDATTKQLSVRLKSYADRDEATLLQNFSVVLDKYYNNPNRHYICGHNIKEFDVPYICRRMVVNQLPFPRLLDISGKKPWELKHLLDTMELWKFGDYKSYTSLKLLAGILGFPSPKDDIDGSEVGRVFWEEDDLERIAKYCEKDVLAVVQLLLKYMRQPILEDSQVVSV